MISRDLGPLRSLCLKPKEHEFWSPLACFFVSRRGTIYPADSMGRCVQSAPGGPAGDSQTEAMLSPPHLHLHRHATPPIVSLTSLWTGRRCTLTVQVRKLSPRPTHTQRGSDWSKSSSAKPGPQARPLGSQASHRAALVLLDEIKAVSSFSALLFTCAGGSVAFSSSRV